MCLSYEKFEEVLVFGDTIMLNRLIKVTCMI